MAFDAGEPGAGCFAKVLKDGKTGTGHAISCLVHSMEPKNGASVRVWACLASDAGEPGAGCFAEVLKDRQTQTKIRFCVRCTARIKNETCCFLFRARHISDFFDELYSVAQHKSEFSQLCEFRRTVRPSLAFIPLPVQDF